MFKFNKYYYQNDALTVRTITRFGSTAPRLVVAPVRIEIGIAHRIRNAQTAAVRVDHLHVVGVVGRQSIAGVLATEQRIGGVQADDDRQLADGDLLAGQANDVSAQTVADHQQIGQFHVVRGD